MSNTKKICMLGLGIALYVVLSMTVKIPLISHIQTDLGYIAFGVYCTLFGCAGAIVGVVGCLLESLLISGWVPMGWMLGQLFIGIMCGIAYRKLNNRLIKVLITVVAVFIGVALIKTVVECYLFTIPLEIKFVKNFIAFVADVVPMVLGMFLGEWLKKFVEV